MRSLMPLTLVLSLVAAGCGTEDDTGGEPAATPPTSSPTTERGGTITVGEEGWTIVPAIQCAIYPGDVVSIAGHAGEDPSLEIVIDYGGPNQVVVGSGRDVLWQARKDTIEIEMDGRRVRGTATFTRFATGTEESRQGSFDVTC